MTLKQ